uniref:Uncharacterized protein n=1 Tax=Panagrolaimus sp. ES5 TaxID=591445 RepID=A0AC34FJH0_9BILA
MIMDNLNTFCLGASKVGQVLATSLVKMHNHEPIISKEDLIKLFSEDEVLAQATENALFKIIEDIVEQKDENIQANIPEHITNLKCATDYRPNEKAGKMLREKGKELLEVLLKIKANETSSQEEELKEAKASAKMFLKTYQEAVELKNKANEEDKLLKAEMSRERQNLMQTRADNLKVVQEALDSESKHLNLLNEKRESISQAINNAINKMANLNCEEVDLNEILECLEEVIQVLTSIQTAYYDIIHYFNYVKELIDGPLLTQIQDVTKFIVNDNETIKSLTDRQQRILLTEIIKACSLSYILMQGSKFYKELSDKHIMPILDNALHGNAMPKEEAKNRKNEISSNLMRVKYEVAGAIDSQSMFIRNHVYKLLKKQGFDVSRAIEN